VTAIERTFVFADLSGYTALTEAHGDEDAAAVAGRFAEIARSVIDGSGRLVKTVGDAVMLALDTPEHALRTVSALRAVCVGEPRFPALRVGMHHGHAIERDGDYFGAAVNLAARVAAHAALDQILCTELVAEACKALPGFQAHCLGEVTFKNVNDPVVVFEVRMERATGTVNIDPVCRMRVDPATALRVVVDGEAHMFCSESCANVFSHRRASKAFTA